MKALSVRQPWANLIVTVPNPDEPIGIKDVENRTWKTNYRGRVLIHATKKQDGTLNSVLYNMFGSKGALYDKFKKTVNPMLNPDYEEWRSLFDDMPTSAIIGSVEIIDCVQNYPSIWSEEGCWHWVLRNPIKFKEPILNVKGKLSFWEYDNKDNLLLDAVECKEEDFKPMEKIVNPVVHKYEGKIHATN